MVKLSRAETLNTSGRPTSDRKAFGPGTFFGAPIGDLGWFTSLIMGLALGFMAFFLATFCGIITILVLNSLGHRGIDFAISYRRIGLPAGIVVGTSALLYLGTLWARRHLRRG